MRVLWIEIGPSQKEPSVEASKLLRETLKLYREVLREALKRYRELLSQCEEEAPNEAEMKDHARWLDDAERKVQSSC